MTLLTSGSTFMAVATDNNMNVETKVWTFAVLGLNTTNALDDYAADSLKIASGREEYTGPLADTIHRVAWGMAVISILAFVAVLNFWFSIIRWWLGVRRGVVNERRLLLYTLIVWGIFIGLLTQFTLPVTILELVGIL